MPNDDIQEPVSAPAAPQELHHVYDGDSYLGVMVATPAQDR